MRHGIWARFWTVTGVVIAAMSFSPLAAAGASFKLLSEITGKNLEGTFSADESTIIGYLPESGYPAAVRWSKESGLQSFPFMPDFPLSAPAGVSDDGSVVAVSAYGGAFGQAFLWATNEILALGSIPGGVDKWAQGVSGDGSTIVGYAVLTDGVLEAFRWTRSQGMQGLGSLVPQGTIYARDSVATAVSADGSVVVGTTDVPKVASQAFRWTAAEGMKGLGYPQGAFTSSAYAVSADGSVIAGFAQYDNGNGITYDSAFRWTASKGMQAIPELVGFQSMSADGKVIFGDSHLGGLRWTEKGGARRVHEIFAFYGIDLSGWDLNNLMSVSADGSTFGGQGRNPDGKYLSWVGHIPPGTPVVGNVSKYVSYGASINWKPVMFDPEGDTLKCRIIAYPENGTATLASDCASGTYQPKPGFIGTDSFTYVANDGQSDSSPGTVTMAVSESTVDQLCTLNNPLTRFTHVGKQHELAIYFTGYITAYTSKSVKICPGTNLTYTTSSVQWPVVCRINNTFTRDSGSLKINDHIKCTNKPAGKDKVQFKVKSGVK